MAWGSNRLRVAGVRLVAIAVGLGVSGPFALANAAEPDPETATKQEIIRYYDSGEYMADTRAVVGDARASLLNQLGGAPSDGGDAIVFDIDDTALSSYQCQKRLGSFGSAEEAVCVIGAGTQTTTATGKGLPRIGPVHGLYRLARENNVKVFFITARPEFARRASIENLRARGYHSWKGLILAPTTDFVGTEIEGGSFVPYKSGARAAIERKGYEILVNIGDQQSDLKGGHANRTFKVPNPMYFTP